VNLITEGLKECHGDLLTNSSDISIALAVHLVVRQSRPARERENLSNKTRSPAMNRTEAKTLNGFTMLCSSVALVISKPLLRVHLIHFNHIFIAGNLRHH
jgi:hypothetical protein